MRKDSEKFLEIVLQKREEEGINTIICGLETFNEIPNIDTSIDDIMDDLKVHNCISRISSRSVIGEVEIIITLDGIEYFKEKEKQMSEEQKITNNTNIFYGEVTGVQIQQGTKDLSQTQTVNQGFNYDEVKEIVEKIKKYDAFFDDEYGERAPELRNKINEIESLLQKKDEPSKIKMLLSLNYSRNSI